MSAVEIITEAGAAQADLDGDASDARFLLVLTHGAGGSVQAPDVLAARDAGRQLGGLVARITQPYRVRGARAPGSAARQDAAWLQVVTALGELVSGVPLVQGGRSNGARVACRTAAAAGARAVVALAFPLHPPGATAPDTAAQVRLAELRAARAGGARVLVVNGERDPFGIPAAQDADRVIAVPGETHSLRGHRTEIVAAITEWLPSVLLRVARAAKPVNRGAAGQMVEQLSGGIKKALKGSSDRIFGLAHEELPLRSGRWSLAPVPGDHADRAVEWCQVSRPVRLDAGAVRQQFPGVLEHHDTVAEQAPSLLRVAHDGVCRFAVRI